MYVHAHTHTHHSPVESGPVPEDQIIITVVANSTTTKGIQADLMNELDRLTDMLGCRFIDLERFGE